MLYSKMLENYHEILNTPRPRKSYESVFFTISLVVAIAVVASLMYLWWPELSMDEDLVGKNRYIFYIIVGFITIFTLWAGSLFGSIGNKDGKSRHQRHKEEFQNRQTELNRLLHQHQIYMIEAKSEYMTDRKMMAKVMEIDKLIRKIK